MSVKEEQADKYTPIVRVTGLPGTPTENSEFIRGVIFVGPPKSAAK